MSRSAAIGVSLALLLAAAAGLAVFIVWRRRQEAEVEDPPAEPPPAPQAKLRTVGSPSIGVVERAEARPMLRASGDPQVGARAA